MTPFPSPPLFGDDPFSLPQRSVDRVVVAEDDRGLILDHRARGGPASDLARNTIESSSGGGNRSPTGARFWYNSMQ